VLRAVLEDAGHEREIRSVSLAATWQGLAEEQPTITAILVASPGAMTARI